MNSKHVSVFIPCLVDQVYPEMGIAMIKLLRSFGYEIFYHKEQTCCGQPAFNAGQRKEAIKVAGHFVEVFAEDGLIVSPSGSCTAMVRKYFPNLFEGHHACETAAALGGRVLEFSEFIQQEDLLNKISGKWKGRIGFHNSCHSYRELDIDDFPLRILKRIDGVEPVRPPGEPVCCGFGGLFSFKFPAVSATMARSRLEQFFELGLKTIVSNDPGCIMHLRQEAKDKNMNMDILHLVEFLERTTKTI